MSIGRSSFLTLSAAFAAASVLPASAKTEQDAVRLLLAGNRRYANGATIHGDQTARRDEVKGGQKPFAMILSCADSRVPPELIFDQTLGDIFVVRVAGNYAETGGIGSFEYAFEHFHSGLLMVLGHSGCGAVKATVDLSKDPSAHAPGDIAAIVDALMPAVRAVRGKSGDLVTNAIAQNARMNAAKLAAEPPILSAGVRAGKLRTVAAVYDLASGLVKLV